MGKIKVNLTRLGTYLTYFFVISRNLKASITIPLSLVTGGFFDFQLNL